MYPDKLNNIENDNVLLAALEDHVDQYLHREFELLYPAALLDRVLAIAKKIAYANKISDSEEIFYHISQGQKYSIETYSNDVEVLRDRMSDSAFNIIGKFTSHTLKSVVTWIKENQ